MTTHYQVMRPFSIIVAADEKGGIGKDGNLPWRIPADLKYFKEITTKASSTKAAEAKKVNAVIMGRKTWESIPDKFRPLPGRLNVILSSTMKEAPEEDIPNVKIVNGDLQKALTILTEGDFVQSVDRVFVIGGGTLYNEALSNKKLPLHHVFITRVTGDHNCDVTIDFKDTPKGFHQVTKGESQTEGDFTFSFDKYSRVNKEEQQYLDLVEDIILNGVKKGDRTGVGTISRFGAQMRFSLRDGSFPLLTTKRVFWTGVAEELFWFIKGETDGKTLKAKGVGIWDDNGTREFLDGRGLQHREVGDLGPIYGFQWRHFGAEYGTCHDDYTGKGIDQLAEVIHKIKNNPNDRRIIMSAWNPTAMPEMALPPCHILSQFYVANGELSCQMYQRSCDMGLGVPFNIASYSLLTIILADICGLKPGDFIHTLGDAHVYSNHVEPLQTQLERNPRPFPVVKIVNHHDKVEDYCMDDFAILDYAPMPTIKMQMAV